MKLRLHFSVLKHVGFNGYRLIHTVPEGVVIALMAAAMLLKVADAQSC